MRQIGNDEFLPAAVPGSVYGDLLSNGKMENPFWKDNENDACELMEKTTNMFLTSIVRTVF